MAAAIEPTVLPPRYQELKARIAASVPNFKERVTASWSEIIEELAKRTAIMVVEGSEYIPRVKFSDLDNLSPERIAEIKQKGCMVIRDIVDDSVAAAWKTSLKEFIKTNPDVEGLPVHDKQFFRLHWTQPQLEARSHPNILATSRWLNNLYKSKDGSPVAGVDLNTPLSYADRFRIRHPGYDPWWNALRPHSDGGGIERWEDESFRACFADILSGNWREHDPYELASRVEAKRTLYQRNDQATIFRTFQGWLAISELAPKCGTLQIFPDVQLSNAYSILRPFFTLKDGIDPLSEEALSASSWQYDISSSEFPGITASKVGLMVPRPTTKLHPHLKLESTMISMPKVYPGDMVFWHGDMIHAVEKEHNGTGDAAVMYIGAVPLTPQTADYIFGPQLEAFMQRTRPGDFSGKGGTPYSEAHFKGIGTPESIVGEAGRRAMGLIQ